VPEEKFARPRNHRVNSRKIYPLTHGIPTFLQEPIYLYLHHSIRPHEVKTAKVRSLIIGFSINTWCRKSGFDLKLQVKIPIPTCLGRPTRFLFGILPQKKKAPWRVVFFKAGWNQPGISGSSGEKKCLPIGPTWYIWIHMINMIQNDLLPSL
jgi:hypothetical protein